MQQDTVLIFNGAEDLSIKRIVCPWSRDVSVHNLKQALQAVHCISIRPDLVDLMPAS